jgi:ribosomal protein L21E
LPNSIETFEPGEILSVTIEEVISEQYLICAYQGRLYRIRNETGLQYKKSDQVLLNYLPESV